MEMKPNLLNWDFQLNSSNTSTFRQYFDEPSENVTEAFPNDTKEDSFLSRLHRFPVHLWSSQGLFDESFALSSIDAHWIRFQPASRSIHLALAWLYVFIMIGGSCGNLLVMSMFYRCKSLRTPANYLIVNLAISDFFMLAKSPVFIYNSMYEGPALGSIGCQIYGFVGGLTGTASIMSLTAISLDRYLAIVHPLDPFKRTTVKRAMGMIIFIWIYAFFFASLPLLGLNSYVCEGYLTSCSFNYLATDLPSRIFVFCFFIAAWVFPLAVITFSYFRIYSYVRKVEQLNNFTSKDSSVSIHRNFRRYRAEREKIKTEVKIALVSTAVICLWIVAWTPYAIVALLGVFGQKHLITPIISVVPALFCKSASALDPFLYAINHPRFQKELRSQCESCLRRRLPQRTRMMTRMTEISLNSFATVVRESPATSDSFKTKQLGRSHRMDADEPPVMELYRIDAEVNAEAIDAVLPIESLTRSSQSH